MKNIVPISFFLLLLSQLCYGQITVLPKPLKEFVNKKITAPKITRYLTEKKWNQLFPKRYGIGQKDSISNNPDFYSYKTFVQASKLFPSFLSDGNDTIQKRELSAFLANIAQETSGGWDDAPGGYFKWGLYFLEETNAGIKNQYNDTSKKNYPAIEGKFYYGRGPKQLTWNYNYGQFSEAWFGSKDTLLLHPELLSKDPLLSFASALWFWMTPQFSKTFLSRYTHRNMGSHAR